MTCFKFTKASGRRQAANTDGFIEQRRVVGVTESTRHSGSTGAGTLDVLYPGPLAQPACVRAAGGVGLAEDPAQGSLGIGHTSAQGSPGDR